MKHLRLAIAAALVLCPTLLRAADPFAGRWVLDTKRSQYPVGSCPKQMTIEMAPEGDAVHYHSETQLSSGVSFSADYVAKYDGKPAMVMGAKGVLLPVSLTRLKPNVVVAKYMSGLETRATSRREVSTDGNVMTVTTSSRDGAGNVIKNVGVYRKASGASGFDLARAKLELLSAK